MKSDLDRARNLYAKKKYTRVIRLLEPQVFQYRDSFTFYYYLGMSCVSSGDSGGGKTYLDRALGIKPNDTNALAGLAVVHIKRFEVTEAIQCYLDIIDNEPDNRLAARGLKLIRNNADIDRLTPMVERGRADSLLPREKSFTWLYASFAAIIIIAMFAGGYLIVRDRLRGPIRENEVSALTLKQFSVLTDTTAEAKIALTERDIEKSFAQAKRYFAEFRDNMALREINRILLSNATVSVKEQVKTIASFIEAPNFTTISDSFSYEEVSADPQLYRGTFVAWRGRTSNIAIGTKSITLDLLVGYDTNEVLDGVVPVFFEFGIDVANGRPVEVLGEVIPTEDGILLRGISLHKLADG